jgi:hypothetical protein
MLGSIRLVLAAKTEASRWIQPLPHRALVGRLQNEQRYLWLLIPTATDVAARSPTW